MTYQIAVLSAELDADCYSGIKEIKQEASRSRVVLLIDGQVVGVYHYKD
jgi:hypothetical protein